jgi:DNA-binding CsgD family transcriptional regulator
MVAAVSVSEKEAGLPLSLLSDLMAQVGCDLLTFSGQDTRCQEFSFVQDIPGEDSDDEDGGNAGQPFWAAYQGSAHRAYPDLGDLRSVTKTSDFYSARQWHNTRMYAEGIPGIEHMLMLCLSAGPGPDAKPGPGPDLRLVLHRESCPDFSEHDRVLLELLRPHLLQPWADIQRRRRAAPLTPRHWELLRLVAVGYTNAQVARRLGISAGTVRTHLRNIYSILRVPSRTAAVTRAFPDRTAL